MQLRETQNTGSLEENLLTYDKRLNEAEASPKCRSEVKSNVSQIGDKNFLLTFSTLQNFNKVNFEVKHYKVINY